MIEYNFYVQSSERPGDIFNGLIETANGVRFDELHVFMAYASLKGCYLLNETLTKECHNWTKSKKRWLISFDGGITEPSALSFLKGLKNSEVRIPRGLEVLTKNLAPRALFHHKLYFFESLSLNSLAVFGGSP